MKTTYRWLLCCLLLGVLLLCPFLGTSASAASTLTISTPANNRVYMYDDAKKVTWGKVTGAVKYYVSVRNINTDELVLENKSTTSTSMTITKYIPDTPARYRVWVGAVDSSSKTGAEAFTADEIIIYVGNTPEVTNGSATNITTSSVTLKMTIDLDNGYAITDWGFYVGTSSTTSKMEKHSFGSTKKGSKTATIKGLLPGQKYYYRAFAENELGEECSAAKNFTTEDAILVVTKLSDPTLTYPVSGNTYPEGNSIKMQWTSVSGVDGYRCHIKQLSGEPDYVSNDEAYVNLWEPSVSSSRLYYTLSASKVKGGYWYKFVVEAYADGKESGWSPWCYVYIEKDQLADPNIVSPADNSTLIGSQDIVLDWDAVSGADGYRYKIKQLSGTPDRTNNDEPALNTIEGSTTSSVTKFTLSASHVVPGYWYKFVVEAYADDIESGWSDWHYVYVQGGELAKPVVVSPVDGATYSAGQSILFDWEPVAGAQKYNFKMKRLSGTPDRTNENEPAEYSLDGSTISTATQFTFPASQVIAGYWYKFVVQAYAEGMEPNWSAWTYCYVETGSLDKPIITTPTNWTNKAAGSSITVKWNSVDGAEGYRMHAKQLSGAPDTANDDEPAVNEWLTSCGTSRTYTLAASNVKSGYWYKFVVEAYATNMNPGWSEWIYLYVPEPASLARAVITSPVSTQGYEAGKSIEFTWSQVANATSYTYYVKELLGEPNYSDNESASASWSATTGTSASERAFTLEGTYVQPETWYKFVVKAEARGYDPSWSRYTYVKTSAFMELIDIVLPSGLTTLELEAFASAEQIGTVNASTCALKNIDNRTFAGCVNMTDIYLPDTIEFIAEDAFSSCPNLTIHCLNGSYAHQYAIRKGISVEVTGVVEEADSLSIEPIRWDVSSKETSERIVDINASTDWSATTRDDWLLVEAMPDSNTSVVVTAMANPSGKSRRGFVTFTAGQATAVLTVRQKGTRSENCTLSLSETKWEPVSAVGNTSTTFSVSNHATYTIESDSTWLTCRKEDNDEFTASIPNEALGTAKTGHLTITCDACGVERVFTVAIAGANIPAPSSIKATAIDQQTIKIEWDKVSNALYYNIYRSEDGKNWRQIDGHVMSRSYTDDDLIADTTYYYRVRASRITNFLVLTGKASEICSAATPSQVAMTFTGAYADLKNNGCKPPADLEKISWNPVAGATNYKLSLRNTTSDKSILDRVNVGSKTTYAFQEIDKPKEGQTYRVWVGAYNEYGHLIGQTPALNFKASNEDALALTNRGKIAAHAESWLTTRFLAEGVPYYTHGTLERVDRSHGKWRENGAYLASIDKPDEGLRKTGFDATKPLYYHGMPYVGGGPLVGSTDYHSFANRTPMFSGDKPYIKLSDKERKTPTPSYTYNAHPTVSPFYGTECFGLVLQCLHEVDNNVNTGGFLVSTNAYAYKINQVSDYSNATRGDVLFRNSHSHGMVVIRNDTANNYITVVEQTATMEGWGFEVCQCDYCNSDPNLVSLGTRQLTYSYNELLNRRYPYFYIVRLEKCMTQNDLEDKNWVPISSIK